MQLGRTYLDAGKRTEAQQTFNRSSRNSRIRRSTADAKRNWKA